MVEIVERRVAIPGAIGAAAAVSLSDYLTRRAR